MALRAIRDALGQPQDLSAINPINLAGRLASGPVGEAILGNAPGLPGGPSPGLALLFGPAARFIRQSSPGLARYLHKRPEMIYARWNPRLGPNVLGETYPMGTAGAERLNAERDAAADVRRDMLLPRQRIALDDDLPRSLRAGDIGIDFHPALKLPLGALPVDPHITGIHEGMHGSWLAKVPEATRRMAGELTDRGNLSREEAQQILAGGWRTAPPVGKQVARGATTAQRLHDWLDPVLDLEKEVRVGRGPRDPEHSFLHAAATRAAQAEAKRRGRP